MAMTADDMRRSFAAWRAANQEAWAYIEREAVAAMKAGRKFSIRPLVERLRWQDLVNADGDSVGIPNVIVPCFVRQLISDYPEMKQLITRQRSKLDADDPLVNDGAVDGA